MLTGPLLPLSFHLTWQAVPGPVILCNLLSVGQFQFMTLQPINFTSIKRSWCEFAFCSSANRGLAASPSLATQPKQIQVQSARKACASARMLTRECIKVDCSLGIKEYCLEEAMR